MNDLNENIKAHTVLSHIELEVLAWFARNTKPYPKMHTKEGENALANLIKLCLINKDLDTNDGLFLTEKGEAYISTLCCTPIPINVWINEKNEIVF